MKKLIIITFLIFQTINCLSQNKDFYGSVYYRFQQNKNQIINGEKTKQHEKEILEGLQGFITDVKFKLEFVNKTSVFAISNGLTNGLKPKGGLYANKLISNGSYYCDLNKNMQLRKVDGGILVETQPSSIKWILTQETKKNIKKELGK